MRIKNELKIEKFDPELNLNFYTAKSEKNIIGSRLMRFRFSNFKKKTRSYRKKLKKKVCLFLMRFDFN